MIETVYKYLAGLGVAVTLLASVYAYGLHEGKAEGAAALAKTVANLNTAANTVLQTALATQAAQDRARLVASQNALLAVQNEKAAQEAALVKLNTKLKELQNVPIDANWMDTKLPPDIVGLFYLAGGNQDCYNPTDLVCPGSLGALGPVSGG